MKKTEDRKLKRLCIQLESTIKESMRDLPPGEHFHVASIIFEQNKLIVSLKSKIKRLEKQLPMIRIDH